MQFLYVVTFVCVLASAQIIRKNGYVNMEPNMQPTYFTFGGADWPGTCQTETTPTPIDITEYPANPSQFEIVTAANSTFRELRFDYHNILKKDIQFQFMQGLMIAWTFDNTVTVNTLGEDTTHTMGEVHYSYPAEHLFNGVRYPLEAHYAFTMKHPDGRILPGFEMLFLFKEGREDPVQAALLSDAKEVDFSPYLPPNQILDDYYYYEGGVDLPWSECWEPIVWMMPNYILELSPEQLQFWRDAYVLSTGDQLAHGNIRDVQPLGSRTIYHYITPERATSFLP